MAAQAADVFLMWPDTLAGIAETIADVRARAARHGRQLRFGYRELGLEAVILSGYPHLAEADLFARHVLPHLEHGPLARSAPTPYTTPAGSGSGE